MGKLAYSWRPDMPLVLKATSGTAADRESLIIPITGVADWVG